MEGRFNGCTTGRKPKGLSVAAAHGPAVHGGATAHIRLHQKLPWNGRSGALALPGRQTGAAVQAVARLGQVAFGQALGAGAGGRSPWARRCEVISAVTMPVGTASVPQPSSIIIG